MPRLQVLVIVALGLMLATASATGAPMYSNSPLELEPAIATAPTGPAPTPEDPEPAAALLARQFTRIAQLRGALAVQQRGGPHGTRPGCTYVPMRVMTTAYALRGYTASGAYTRPGTIAVDTRVIPFGTRMYVPGYGWGVAQDTGGAIQGKIIDLWMPSSSRCFQWGVRSVTILVEKRVRR
ncbi:MAG: hypothetical protein FJX76_15885 [Armatimonadetes bacterium]|nr:hypothetical protein [Armatimonadota bacterium]